MHKDTASALENLANFKQQSHYNKKVNEVKVQSFCKYRCAKDMRYKIK